MHLKSIKYQALKQLFSIDKYGQVLFVEFEMGLLIKIKIKISSFKT